MPGNDSIRIGQSGKIHQSGGLSSINPVDSDGSAHLDREVSAMKIGVRLGVAAALGLLVAVGSSFQALAQVGIVTPNPYGADGAYNTFNTGGLQQTRIPPQGVWAEVINITPRWMVIQNQLGQQFPIEAPSAGQMLIRWPSTVDALTNQSVIEVTGPEAGSNVIIADHIDIYEGSAQNLVSPAVNNLYGYNRTLSAFDVDQQNSYGVVYWMTPEEYAIPSRMHIVGGAGTGAVRVAGFGQNWYTIQPSTNGMSVTQVTRGVFTDARAGDIVYIVPQNILPNTLVISQMVLYKKIPYAAFPRGGSSTRSKSNPIKSPSSSVRRARALSL
jgi:hypothetical protein